MAGVVRPIENPQPTWDLDNDAGITGAAVSGTTHKREAKNIESV